MATPFQGVADALKRYQPEPARVVLPNVEGRLASVGTVVSSIRSSILAAIQNMQATSQTPKIKWQGFSHTPGTARAPHPFYTDGSQQPLAFLRGFTDLRRASKK